MCVLGGGGGVILLWELSGRGWLRETDSPYSSERTAGYFRGSGEHEYGFFRVMPLGLTLKARRL